RLPRIDDGDRRDVIDDPIHERPRGTRRFHREATLRVASRQQRRNPGIRRWPSLLPRSLAGAIYRADLKKRLVQIDPDVGWLHGRPPLSSGAMSFATNMLRRSTEDGRFIRSRRNTKRTKKKFFVPKILLRDLRSLRAFVVPSTLADSHQR